MKNVKAYLIGILCAVAIGFGLLTEKVLGQSASGSADAHIAAARAAAGTEHLAVFNSLCLPAEERASSQLTPARPATPARQAPPRSE